MNEHTTHLEREVASRRQWWALGVLSLAVVVIGGGYAGVMAVNRLTQRDDVTVTLLNPRPTFVERLRLHQLVGGSHEAVVDALGPDSVAGVVAKAEPNPPADAEDGVAALRHLEDGMTL